MTPSFTVFLIFSLVILRSSAEDALDPCDLPNENGTMVMYCSCSSNDQPQPTEVQCYVNSEFPRRSDDLPEWKAMSTLTETIYLEFIMRYRFMKSFPPPIIFHKMTKLRVFYVKMGAIHVIPSDAFQNSSSIKEVNLKDNQVRVLSPNAFANMNQVTEINLDTNEIKVIERNTFVHLPNLRHLVIGANFIELIHDEAFRDLEFLEELELPKNNLTYLTPEVFVGLKNLKRLDLMKNTIQFLGNNVFSSMGNLEDLDLTGNNIISVSGTAFHGLKKLGRLNLRGNKIVEFLPGTFEHLHMIYFLNVRENELETFSEDLVSNIYGNLLNESMQLIMKDNRFKCDCRILWMNKLYNDSNSQMVQYYLNQTMCDVPHKFALALDETDLTFTLKGDRVLENVTLIVGPIDDSSGATGSSSIRVTSFNGDGLKCDSDRKSQRHRGQKRIKGRNEVKALSEAQAMDEVESDLEDVSAKVPSGPADVAEPVNDSPSDSKVKGSLTSAKDAATAGMTTVNTTLVLLCLLFRMF